MDILEEFKMLHKREQGEPFRAANVRENGEGEREKLKEYKDDLKEICQFIAFL